MNEKESEAAIASREIYLNCKQAKCWMDINFKELLTEKADLRAENENLENALEKDDAFFKAIFAEHPELEKTAHRAAKQFAGKQAKLIAALSKLKEEKKQWEPQWDSEGKAYAAGYNEAMEKLQEEEAADGKKPSQD